MSSALGTEGQVRHLHENGVFQTAPGSFNYRAFEATFLAMDASYHNRHRVALTNPLRRVSTLDPAEFIADENVNFPPRAADSKGSSYRDLFTHSITGGQRPG